MLKYQKLPQIPYRTISSFLEDRIQLTSIDSGNGKSIPIIKKKNKENQKNYLTKHDTKEPKISRGKKNYSLKEISNRDEE